MKKYLVIGNPIDHSLSPKLHNKWFKTAEIEAVYDKKKIEEKDLREIINKVKSEEIDGINITVPFKKVVIPFLDELTPEARRVQSVNTILKKNNKVIGANTDIYGFEESLAYRNFKLKDKKIFILGAGGVVSSIIYVLKKIGVAKITISNRTKKKVEDLKKIYPDLEVIDWGQNIEFDMIINATSLGLGEKDKIGLDFSGLEYIDPTGTHKSENDIKRKVNSTNKLFYDVIYMYGDKETDFLLTGKKLGHETMDGSLMFLHQAAESFRMWHETQPRIDWDEKAQREDLKDLKLHYLL